MAQFGSSWDTSAAKWVRYATGARVRSGLTPPAATKPRAHMHASAASRRSPKTTSRHDHKCHTAVYPTRGTRRGSTCRGSAHAHGGACVCAGGGRCAGVVNTRAGLARDWSGRCAHGAHGRGVGIRHRALVRISTAPCGQASGVVACARMRVRRVCAQRVRRCRRREASASSSVLARPMKSKTPLKASEETALEDAVRLGCRPRWQRWWRRQAAGSNPLLQALAGTPWLRLCS